MSERKRLREQEAEEFFDREREEHTLWEAVKAHRAAKTSGTVPVGGQHPADTALWSLLEDRDD